METTTMQAGMVNILRKNPSTGRVEEVERHPERWVGARIDGVDARFCVKSTGDWFDQGGNPVAPADVPAWAKDMVAASGGPPSPFLNEGPAVVVSCDVCGERMHHTALSTHLLAHYRDLEAHGGATSSEQPRPVRRRQRTTTAPAATDHDIKTAFDEPEGEG